MFLVHASSDHYLRDLILHVDEWIVYRFDWTVICMFLHSKLYDIYDILWRLQLPDVPIQCSPTTFVLQDHRSCFLSNSIDRCLDMRSNFQRANTSICDS